jgi:hypothetical protein
VHTVARMGRGGANIELIEWFDESQRLVCTSCGERASLELHDGSVYCLACAAVDTKETA